MTTPPGLAAVIDEALLPHGFARGRNGSTWSRTSGAREQVLGMRRGRTDDGSRALFIAEHAPGAQPESRFELSPVAPLSNTYWWPVAPGADDVRALQAQLAQVALPFFAAPQQDAAQGQRLVDAPLAPLRDAAPGFTRAEDGTWWRLRGRVIDLVVAEPLALHRFVRPWVAVWHLDLPQGLDGPVPDGVTRAASHTLGRDGLDGEPLAALHALHGPGGWATQGPSWPSAALAWFETLHTAADVLDQVREEYRAALTRDT